MAEYPRESVGIVVAAPDGAQAYLRCTNAAEAPGQHFVLPGHEYAAAEDQGEIVAIVHSHPDGAALASQQDMLGCEASGHPWLIIAVGGDPVAAGGHTMIRPHGFTLPLIGREFDYMHANCYHLIKDWYAAELGIELPAFNTGPDQWWNPKHPNYRPGWSPYEQYVEEAGFRPVSGAPRRGDIITMQIRAEVPNHAAVYIGDGLILQHLSDRLSTRDVYGGYWAEVTRSILRRE